MVLSWHRASADNLISLLSEVETENFQAPCWSISAPCHFVFCQFIHLFKTLFFIIYSKKGSCKGFMQCIPLMKKEHFDMFWDLACIRKTLLGDQGNKMNSLLLGCVVQISGFHA